MPDYDLVIVGLGPVGATAAILCGEAGLRVAVVERDEQVYRLPRAVNLDGEIIRAFQQVGRGQDVADLMQTLRPGDRAGFANAKREWMFGNEPKALGSNGWQAMNMFDQPEFEQYLRDQALSHPNVTSFIGFEATSVTPIDGQVSVTAEPISDGAQGISISARYAIASDGASSFVRKSFDIAWQDLGYDHHWLVVDVIVKEGHTLNNDTVQVCDPQRIKTYVCTKDPYRRWEFKMHPDETAEQMLDPETIACLIDPWTPRDTYEIRRAAVYQFHAAIADQWRVGNIFIAGDAAHQTPPFLGQGMNAGMRDVVNLAWKLPMVANGVATDALLDTYHAERGAHAHDLVDWAVSIGRLMDHLTEVERAKGEGLEPPETPAQLQSAGYGQGREQPPIRDGVVLLEQVSDTGSTGYLFSQPHVENAQGQSTRLDDLMKPGFVVVGKNADALSMSEQSRHILSRIGATTFDLDSLQTREGKLDRLFAESDAAIVRPDRIVFGHTSDQLDIDTMIARLAELLQLTPEH